MRSYSAPALGAGDAAGDSTEAGEPVLPFVVSLPPRPVFLPVGGVRANRRPLGLVWNAWLCCLVDLGMNDSSSSEAFGAASL